MKIVLAGALALVTLASFGAEIEEKSGYSGDSGNASSFVAGIGWSDKKPPTSGNTYVWSKGNLRTTNTTKKATFTFGGDRLTIKGGALTQKSDGDGVLTVIDDLVFLGNDTKWAQSGVAGNTARVQGNFTIKCDTFKITSSYGAPKADGSIGDHKDFLFQGSFLSESGNVPVVTITHHGYEKAASENDSPYRAEFDARLAGDNSGFLGKWIVQNIEPSSGYKRLETRGVVLIAESATALGGDPETAMPDAVRLFNHGGLAVAPELCANGPFAPVNRGITIGSTSGDKVGRLVTISNETWSLGMPITGDNDARLIKCGVGKVRLCGTYAAGPVTVEEGALVWASPSELPAIAVEAGAGLWISASGTRNVSGQTVCGIESVLADQTCGKVVLNETCSLGNGPIGFAFTVAPAADDYTKYEVLNVPVSVRALVPADFYDETPGTTKRWFSVEIEDGVQKVFVAQYPQVKLNTYAKDNPGPHGTDDKAQWYVSDAGVWENNAAPSPSSDYVVNFQVKNSLRTSAGSKDAYVFPGHSLTLKKDMSIADKNAVLVISNLVLGAGANVNASGAAGDIVDQWLQGTMIVSPDTSDSSASIRGGSDHWMSLACDISGSGVLVFRPTSSSTTQTSTLTGDNSRFTGIFWVHSLPDGTDGRQTLIFTKSECLGGARPTFDYRAVRVDARSRLVAASTMTLEAENRGFYFESGSYFSVLGGVVTVKDEIRKAGTLTKDGAGILELAGPVSVAADADRALVVAEGGLGVATPEAFGELVMTFTKDAFLAVNAEAENEDVRTYGAKSKRTDAITLQDNVLNVRIRASDEYLNTHGDFSVPICTVSSTVADAIDGKISVARVRKHRVTVRRETVGSLVRFVADATPTGMCLLFR